MHDANVVEVVLDDDVVVLDNDVVVLLLNDGTGRVLLDDDILGILLDDDVGGVLLGNDVVGVLLDVGGGYVITDVVQGWVQPGVGGIVVTRHELFAAKQDLKIVVITSGGGILEATGGVVLDVDLVTLYVYGVLTFVPWVQVVE